MPCAILRCLTAHEGIGFHFQIAIMFRQFAQEAGGISWSNQCAKWARPQLIVNLQAIKGPCSGNKGIACRKNGLDGCKGNLLPQQPAADAQNGHFNLIIEWEREYT